MNTEEKKQGRHDPLNKNNFCFAFLFAGYMTVVYKGNIIFIIIWQYEGPERDTKKKKKKRNKK